MDFMNIAAMSVGMHQQQLDIQVGKEMRISAARFSMNLLPNVLRSFIT